MASATSLAQSEQLARRWAAHLLHEHGRASGLDSMANNAATNVHGSAKNVDVYNDLRCDRWRQRATVRRLLKGTRIAMCGRPVSKVTGIGLYWSKEHGARFSGLRTCGSVWVCPVCNHKIQTGRQQEVKAVLDHCKSHDWGVVFGTLTVRHKLSDSLKDVIDMAREVWRKSRSHRRIKDLFSRTHEVGYLRNMEITYSRVNGWHVHFHVFYIFDHILPRSESDDFAGAYAAEWVGTAKRCGYAAPLAANQQFDALDLSKVSTLEAAAKYCTISKTATTPQTSRLSNELTNTQSKIGKIKIHGNGKKVLHLTYWDFIRILADKTVQSERTLSDNGYTYATVTTLAREYYKATKGCRALVWSRGLRAMAGLDDELTDEQLAAQDFTENAIHVLTIWHWSVNVSRREYLASLLLGICDRSNGSVELCTSFCQSMDICIQNSVRRI